MSKDKKKIKKHRPSKYMVLAHNGSMTFGWRCRCGIPSRRFLQRALRDSDAKKHATTNHLR